MEVGIRIIKVNKAKQIVTALSRVTTHLPTSGSRIEGQIVTTCLRGSMTNEQIVTLDLFGGPRPPTHV